MKTHYCAYVVVLHFSVGLAAPQEHLSSTVQEYVRNQERTIALEHVRVIDGTGSGAKLDQTILIAEGRIAAVGDTGSLHQPAGATRLDLTGFTAIPGIVGMHEHLFYPGDDALYHDMPYSFPRLYLASGVTTIRTAGSFEPYTDLELRRRIEEGTVPGPTIRVTGPYLEGSGTPIAQFHQLTDPADARRTVDYWAREGATSFKAYKYITPAELQTAISAAHAHHAKITGHLCSVGFHEAAQMGIDNLEHGLFVDSEFFAGKQPGICPSFTDTATAILKLDVSSEPIRKLISYLVQHRVAVTSTLPVFEQDVSSRPDVPKRVLDCLSDHARRSYQTKREKQRQENKTFLADLFVREMQFERAFVAAGGLLIAGADPTGNGGTLAGFGDQREIELLVEAGFTPIEAISIATLNGAKFLGEQNNIGSLTSGKQADIVILQGNPVDDIRAIEQVEIVFKRGIGYDSKRLIDSVRGQVGLR